MLCDLFGSGNTSSTGSSIGTITIDVQQVSIDITLSSTGFVWCSCRLLFAGCEESIFRPTSRMWMIGIAAIAIIPVMPGSHVSTLRFLVTQIDSMRFFNFNFRWCVQRCADMEVSYSKFSGVGTSCWGYVADWLRCEIISSLAPNTVSVLLCVRQDKYVD